MTAQAVAKEMIRWGRGGSIAFIASMSGTVVNKVRRPMTTSDSADIRRGSSVLRITLRKPA